VIGHERFIAALLVLVFLVMPASAYIGPGIGAGAIAIVLGVLGSFFLALVTLIYYPIKRAIGKRKKKPEGTNTENEEEED
jgi:membrane protein implicated in regulation of membrane protease activity